MHAPELLAGVEALIPAMQAGAALLDRDAAFPHQDLAALQELSLAAAPLPTAWGGLGAGTTPEGAGTILALLTMLGRGNPSIGRLFEAHVNALRLIHRYGAAAHHKQAADLAKAGHLIGLWVTDLPGQPLEVAGTVLRGGKGPCSGAGHLRHALVTISGADDTRLALLALDGTEPVRPLSTLPGMRAAANGMITLDGVPLKQVALLGQPGDYLREPDFSTGAWRTTAVTLGALQALTDLVRQQLVGKARHTAPLQQQRFGQLLIAAETARLWTAQAAIAGEQPGQSNADRVAYVNLARIAVESACLDAIRLAQRSLGLPGLIPPNPVERLIRDLTIYLRQPAADDVLLEAAQHGFRA